LFPDRRSAIKVALASDCDFRYSCELVDDEPDSETAWIAHAKCRGLPAEWFYPEGRGGTLTPVYSICNGQDGQGVCPVLLECDQYATRNNEVGVWGGRYHSDRRARPSRAIAVVVKVKEIPRRG
jgi:hypothetical protein